MKLSTIAGVVAALGIAASLAPAPVAAQADWPNRPVRVIVPFGAGGAADVLGRSVAQGLSEAFGQQFVVENVTGAGGVIGVTALANATPDNYTFGVINVSTTVIGPATNPNVTYDPNEAFAYVAMLGGAPTVVAVNAGLGITTLDQLVEAARGARPLMAYGSPGTATMSNLVPAAFFLSIGVDVEHIPYQGASQAVTDAVAGHIPFIGTTLSTARAQLDAGTLIPLAISTGERHPDFPDVPTFAELGHADLTSLTWFGFAGPAGVDAEIVNRLNAEVRRILASEEVTARLEAEGFVLLDFSPEEFYQYQLDQMAVFGPVAAELVQ
jgi:tripartite-type tricarboxylate transporter receptor subunit TctC